MAAETATVPNEIELFTPTGNDKPLLVLGEPDDDGIIVDAFEEDVVDEKEAAAKVESKAEEKPAEEKPAEKTAETHTVEAIARAVIAGVPESEIAEMSPAELRRTTRMMETVNERIKTAAPKAETKTEPNEDEEILKKLDDETLFDPSAAAVMKSILAKNQRLEKELASIKPSVENVAIDKIRQEVNTALDAIKPGFAKEFDPTSPKGASQRQKLFGMMNAIYESEKQTGEFTDTNTRARRAVAALEMMPAVEAKKDEALKKAEEAFDAGALASGVSRKPTESVVDVVEKMLASNRRAKKQPGEQRPKWND